MSTIRLKCSIDPKQVENRLKYNPEIVELQLMEQDMYEIDKIYQTIHLLKEKRVQVYLHHPMKLNGQFIDILSSNQDILDFYHWTCEELSKICQKEKIYCVVHAHYSGTESSEAITYEQTVKMKQEIEKVRAYETTYFLWENTIEGLFSHKNPDLLETIVKPLQLPLCFDISHSFISVHGDNDVLKQKLEEFQPYTRYFHVVDSEGLRHDALPLGEGKTDWKMVKPFLYQKPFIFEIGLADFTDCKEMIESVEFFNAL